MKKIPQEKTTEKKFKRGEEVWIKDFYEFKGCSKQATYVIIQKGLVDTVQKFGTTFIIWDKKAEDWSPRKLLKQK